MFRLSVVRRVGAVAIVLGTTTVWALTATQEAELQPDDGTVTDRFGLAVAIDGNTTVIGAPGNNDNGADSGSAYVFTRTAGVWTQQAKLLPVDGAPADDFGSTVALDGATALPMS